MRAGLFLHHLENTVNSSRASAAVGSNPGSLLLWEHWGIRKDQADIDRYNRSAITLVFTLLAFGFLAAGFLRLYKADDLVYEQVAVAGLILAVLIGVVALRWVLRLMRYAYSHRAKYSDCASGE